VTAYRYGEHGGAAERSLYHYAPFEGQAFLDAYAAHRRAMIEACDGAGACGHDALLDERVAESLRKRFEVRGRLEGDAMRCAAQLWASLAHRSRPAGDVRDLNCMLKLGDRVSQLGIVRLDCAGRAWVRAAAALELDCVERLMRGGIEGARRLKSPNRVGVGGACRLKSLNLDGVERARSCGRAFGMVLVNASRSRAYVDVLARCGMRPACVVYVSRGADDDRASGEAVDGFDNVTPLAQRLRELAINTQRIETTDINDARVAQAISRAGVELLVYSGFAGVKVKPLLLRAGAELLHVHGGRVPAQRGSTTSYYSLLEEGCCWASVIVLTEELDRGAVVAQRAYAPPMDRTQLDHGFDPLMRADLLCRVMKRYVESGLLPRLAQPRLGTMHFVMHPVLRHVAILTGGRDGAAAQMDIRETALAAGCAT